MGELARGNEVVRCELRPGHAGGHSGRSSRSYIEWPVPNQPAAAGAHAESDTAELTAESLPRNAYLQHCHICGSRQPTWVHPIRAEQRTFRVFDKRTYTLNSFGCLCDACERLLADGEVDVIVDRKLRVNVCHDEWDREVLMQGLLTFLKAVGPAQRLAPA